MEALEKYKRDDFRVIAKAKNIIISRGAKKDQIIRLIRINQSKNRNIVIQDDVALLSTTFEIVTNSDG